MTTPRNLNEMPQSNANESELKGPLHHFPVLKRIWGPTGESILKAAIAALGILFLTNSGCNTKKAGKSMWPTRRVESVFSVAFSPDNRYLVCAGSDGKITVVDWKSRLTIKTIKAHDADVYTVVFSPDGRLLASGAFDSLVKIWDTSDWKERAILKGHKEGVITSCFSVSGRELASGEGARGSQVLVWDIETGKREVVFSGHKYGTHGLLFSQDGAKLFSAGGDGYIGIHDLKSGATVDRIRASPPDQSIDCMARNPRGMEFATGSSDGMIRFWDFSGNCIRSYKGILYGNSAIAFSPQGQYIAIAGGEDPHGPCCVKLLDVSSGRECQALKGYVGVATRLAFSPDGKTLAIGRIDGEPIFWDIEK